MKPTIALILALMWTGSAMAGSCAPIDEIDAQKVLCEGKQQEVRLKSGGRADCVDETHAIEVEFTDGWAEALGQSLYYASALDKKPAIYLVCCNSQKNCLAHSLRLEQTIAKWGLDVDVQKFDASQF